MKLRTTLFILILVGLVLPSVAQQPDTLYWPTDTAWWCVQDWHYDQQTGETTSKFKYYKMYGDTTANGHEWQKVHFSKFLAFDSPYNRLHCLTRLEDKVVHIKYMPPSGYADTNEYVLYDFNLVVGDTFQFHLLNWETDSVFEFGVFYRGYYTLANNYVICEIAFDWLDHSVPMWGGECQAGGLLNWQTTHGAINPSPFWMEYPQYYCIDSLAALHCFKWGGANPIIDQTSVIQCDSTGIGIQELPEPGSMAGLIVVEGVVMLPADVARAKEYTLFSLSGATLKSGTVKGHLLNLEMLPPGIFLLEVLSDDRIWNFRIVNL